jgi:hypothetical protein
MILPEKGISAVGFSEKMKVLSRSMQACRRFAGIAISFVMTIFMVQQRFGSSFHGCCRPDELSAIPAKISLM